MGIAEGLLRIMPNWETHIWGHTISWNIMIPGQVAPFLLFGMVILWPFFEAWVTGDKREHHLLQRPRNAPTRTAFLAAMITVYGLLWAAGGNDILAVLLHMNLNSITYFMRAAVFVVPPIVFYVTRRWCIGLQRADNDRLLHGYETGIIMRAPDGGYTERHLPISHDRAYTITARHRDEVYTPASETDENGVVAPGTRSQRIRAKLSRGMFADNVQKPTLEELEEARHHAEHIHELEADLEHPAAGHEFDDHQLRDTDEVPLRSH
jgi:ubiquinol-cytochrome c reductase cytochrome b subunit